MSGFSTTIDDKELEKLDQAAVKFAGELGGNQVRLIIGRAAQQAVKGHFSDLASDAQHHRTATRLGAPRTGFYLDAADRTQAPQLESDGVSVSVKKTGIAQRLFGGVIVPVTKKWLTIPATAAAYGKRAAEIGVKLRFILFRSNLAALVTETKTVGPKGGAGGTPIGGQIYYWLVKSVTQAPDPTVIPTNEEILEPSVANAQSYLERLWKGAATT